MPSHFSRVRLCVTLWTAAFQAPLSWDSPEKNTRVGCQASFQGIFQTQGLNPFSPALAGGFFTTSTILEALFEQMTIVVYNFDYDQTMRVEDILILI